jgi:hypothetical protein
MEILVKTKGNSNPMMVEDFCLFQPNIKVTFVFNLTFEYPWVPIFKESQILLFSCSMALVLCPRQIK